MIVTLCSDKGSPGVTTLAVALGLVWPVPRLVLEADPAGGDLAFRMRHTDGGGPLNPDPSAATLAAAVRAGLAHGWPARLRAADNPWRAGDPGGAVAGARRPAAPAVAAGRRRRGRLAGHRARRHRPRPARQPRAAAREVRDLRAAAGQGQPGGLLPPAGPGGGADAGRRRPVGTAQRFDPAQPAGGGGHRTAAAAEGGPGAGPVPAGRGRLADPGGRVPARRPGRGGGAGPRRGHPPAARHRTGPRRPAAGRDGARLVARTRRHGSGGGGTRCGPDGTGRRTRQGMRRWRTHDDRSTRTSWTTPWCGGCRPGSPTG